MPAPERVDVSFEDVARAARLLVVRSRRETAGLFAGNYASAFRGGGVEFEESRPYVPGDDVRIIDWNATARNPEPYVKRFHEERDQTLFFLLDVSASMRFGTTGRAKAATAVHALALLAAAAGRAGDRTGLVAFDAAVRAEVPIGRGGAHTWHIIRRAVETASASCGPTSLAAGLRRVRAHTRRRAVLIILSDFRDAGLSSGDQQSGALHSELASLARRHDVVGAAILDPREELLPRVGPIRVADPERPGATYLLNTNSRRARERYRAAGAARRRRLELELRRRGSDVLWLHTNRSPLHALGRFFQERAGRHHGGAA